MGLTLIQKVVQETKRQTSEKLCHGTEDTMLSIIQKISRLK